MNFRRNLLPQTVSDFCCLLLLVIFIPVTFVFELAIVLPEFHATTGWFYLLTCILACFVVFNLKGNMLACMFIDTSIKGEILKPPSDPTLRKYWRLCGECEVLAPPRSWHCQICNTCILKRDHHCLFTACCIGHRNHRYFVIFVLYLAIGAAYTTIYNSIYFFWLHAEMYVNWTTLLKMCFPMFMFTLNVSWRNLYLVIYELNIIAFVYAAVLIAYHAPVVLHGAEAHARKTCKYDLGNWRCNLAMVLGERAHLTWLSPFVESKLPHDGIHWESVLQQTTKNR